MSLYLAPEAAAAIAPPIVMRPLNPRSDTRPVETSDKANPGVADQKQRKPEAALVEKPQPSDRPPGIDPSQPPQSLFEASLISADFKPSTRPSEDLQSQPSSPTPAPGTTATAGGDTPHVEMIASGDPNKNASTASDLPVTATSTAPSGDSRPEATMIAAYTHGAGGTKLPLPATANADLLTSVEKIA